MELNATQQNDGEKDRIIGLHDLIEKNIDIEQKIESHSFGESITAIQHIVSKANDLVDGYQQRRTNPTELMLDTELLRRNHDLVGKAINCQTSITDKMFCLAFENIINPDNQDSENWDAVCALACQHGCPFFTNATMLPFIDVKPKQQVAKQRAVRKSTKNAVEKRPEQSDKLERKGDGSQAVNHVLKQIKNYFRAGNNQPIAYFKLILNPNNFMDSVHNALTVSFLVKENLICIENGPDDMPYVTVNSAPRDIANEETHQLICNLDVKLCNKYIKHYNIREPMLKRLESSDK